MQRGRIHRHRREHNVVGLSYCAPETMPNDESGRQFFKPQATMGSIFSHLGSLPQISLATRSFQALRRLGRVRFQRELLRCDADLRTKMASPLCKGRCLQPGTTVRGSDL